VGGPGTLSQSFEAIKLEGIISVIGFIGGTAAEKQPQVLDTLSKVCTVRGVYVGSRAQFQDMVRAIEANDIKPVIDKTVFEFKDLKEAYNYMVRFYSLIRTPTANTDGTQFEQKHFGKVVIKIQ
jgi:D-arabinose 1-dehydrogenase-like Zn-dependent alcohol dehydrogenase